MVGVDIVGGHYIQVSDMRTTEPEDQLKLKSSGPGGNKKAAKEHAPRACAPKSTNNDARRGPSIGSAADIKKTISGHQKGGLRNMLVFQSQWDTFAFRP